MFYPHKKEDHDSLEQELLKLDKPQISDVHKKHMRDQLLQRIRQNDQEEYLPFSLRHLARAVRRKGREVTIPAWAAVVLKERILDTIESSTSWQEYRLSEGWGGLRAGIAGFLLFAFATTAIFVAPFRTPTVYAQSTYLDDVLGEVKVLRHASVLEGREKMPIEEGDKVVTEEGGTATIHFFDDSVSRLSEKTSVQVKRLHKEPLRPIITHVEVELEEGRMWTRVVNIASDSDFMVDTDSARAGVQKKAAFDVHTNDEMTEVSVYDNVVNVSSKKNSDAPKAVIAGYKVALSKENSELAKVEKIQNGEENVWVAANLTSDETYEAQLSEDKEEMVGLQKESLMLASTFNISNEEVEETRKQIDDAYKSFMNAQAQLVRGTRAEGIEGLQNYRHQVSSILLSLSTIGEKDPLYADLLHDVLKENVEMQLKDLATFKPGDRLYRAKEVLQQTELALASSDVQRVEIQLAQAEDALLEMQSLLQAGEPGLAATLLAQYQSRTNSFTLELTEQNQEELGEKFRSLVEKQANHMKVLTAIEKSVQNDDQQVFRDQVRKVRDDTLRKFLIALEQNPDQISDDVLLNVKDLYDSYVLNEDRSVEDLIDPAVEKLLAKDYQVSFINPGSNGTASEPGVLVLVSYETQASAEVEEGGWLCGGTTCQ